MKAHWDVMVSIDFTIVEVWTEGGLTTFYLLFVMELKTRRVHFAGWTTNPNEAWMNTISLELTNHEDGFLIDKKYLIKDRDAMFSQSFRDFLRGRGREAYSFATAEPELELAPAAIFRIAKICMLLQTDSLSRDRDTKSSPKLP